MTIKLFLKAHSRLILCILLLFIVVGAWSYIGLTFLPSDIKEGTEAVKIEFLWKKILTSFVAYSITTILFFAFRYLFENAKETFFFGLLGILLPVVISTETTKQIFNLFITLYPPTIQFFCFSISLIAYLFLLYKFFGFYPITTKILIKAMRRQILYHDSRNSDWIHEGKKDYPLLVVQTAHVPQNLNFLSNVNLKPLDEELSKFIKKTASYSNRQRAFILVGGLGTGKSTALFRAAEKKLNQSWFNYGTIPVYIKLREWLTNSDLKTIELSGARSLSLEQYNMHIEKICKLIAANTNKTDHDQVIKNLFFSLHEKQRLVYIFDGLNELVMGHAEEIQHRDQFVHDLMLFLHHFSSGNSYILSTCDMEQVITTRSVLIDKENCDYQIFAVKGIDIEADQKKTKKNEKETSTSLYSHFSTNVALYRLAKYRSAKDKKTQALSEFELLESYVSQQLSNELINSKEKELLLALLLNIIEKTVAQNDYEATDDPYTHLVVADKTEDDQRNLRILQNANLLIKEEKEGTAVYRTKHAIIYQYLLAEYARQSFFEPEFSNEKIRENNNDAFLKFFHVANTSNSDPNDSVPSQLLTSPVLRKVFALLISHNISQTDTNNHNSGTNHHNWCKFYLNIVFDSLKEKKSELPYLLLLSSIHDELERINCAAAKNFREALGDSNSEDSINHYLNEQIKDKQIPLLHVQFALIRLSNNADEEILKNLLTSALEKPWVHLTLKRDIVKYLATHSRSSLETTIEKNKITSRINLTT